MMMKSVFVFADALPYSIRILLESAIRNCDEFQAKSITGVPAVC